MADLPDISGLYADDEPTAQEAAAAYADALRRKEAAGFLAQLSGDPTLGQVGSSLLSSAQQGNEMIARASGQRLSRALQLQQASAEQSYRDAQLGMEKQRLDQDSGKVVQTDQGIGVVDTRRHRFYPLGDANGAPVRPAPKGGAGGADLSQQALDQSAKYYATTGQMTPLGQGGAALKTKILNRAAELYGDANIAGAKAGFGADQKSLQALQHQADTVNAFEKTALANLDAFLGSARQVVDPGSPLFNAPARKFMDMVAGDPKMAAFKTAREVAVNEVSKVLSGAMGNAAVSDSARHEAAQLLSPDASLAQIEKAAEILKGDMERRRGAVDQQISEIRGRITRKPSDVIGAPSAAPAAGQQGTPTNALLHRIGELKAQGLDAGAIKAQLVKEGLAPPAMRPGS